MRLFPYFALSLVLTAGISTAATFTIDFEDPVYSADDDPGFEGVDGWVQSVANPPSSDGEYAPYAWIWPSFASGNALLYGGVFDSVPDGFTVSRTFSGLTAGEKSLSFQNHITDAHVLPPGPFGTFEGRDNFGFQIKGAGGDLLLTVDLRPANQDYIPDGEGGYKPGVWMIYYAFGSDTPISTGNGIESNAVNSFSVDFEADRLTFNYGQGNFVWGTTAGYDVNDTEFDLIFTYATDGDGENHIRIDDITVVDAIPEPTTAALAALGSLALLRRRRTR